MLLEKGGEGDRASSSRVLPGGTYKADDCQQLSGVRVGRAPVTRSPPEERKVLGTQSEQESRAHYQYMLHYI